MYVKIRIFKAYSSSKTKNVKKLTIILHCSFISMYSYYFQSNPIQYSLHTNSYHYHSFICIHLNQHYYMHFHNYLFNICFTSLYTYHYICQSRTSTYLKIQNLLTLILIKHQFTPKWEKFWNIVFTKLCALIFLHDKYIFVQLTFCE